MSNNRYYEEVKSPKDILSFVNDYKVSTSCFKRVKNTNYVPGIVTISILSEIATNKKVAVKHKNIKKSIDEKKFYEEICLCIFVNNHPCINKFVGFNIKKKTGVVYSNYCPNLSLNIIFDKQRKGTSKIILNNTNKLTIIYGIAAGMSFLHSHDILHLDLTS